MTITADRRSKLKLKKLTNADRKRGVEILNALETVERAKRLNDHIPLVVTNIFRNEMGKPGLVKFLEEFTAVDDLPAQKALVETLLVTCYESQS